MDKKPDEEGAGICPAATTSTAPAPAQAAATGKVCTFFPKPTRNKNIRKRQIDESDGEEEESRNFPLSAPKSRKLNNSKLSFSSTSNPTTSNSKPYEDGDDDASNPRLFQYESSKAIQIANDSRATATLETETEFDRDSRAIRERQLKQAEESLRQNPSSKNPNRSGELYKGVNAYTDHKQGFRREQTLASEKAGGSHGPLRASAHIRTSVRFDYQPDICKDYKETGYCGYGDSCKFMHDRGDYKSGWQLERDWDESEKARKRAIAMKGEDDEDGAEEDDEDEDGLPFACFICRRPFEDPVVTKCKHYFCEHCALKHHSKNKKCFVCDKPTMGIFNVAHEIRKRKVQEK